MTTNNASRAKQEPKPKKPAGPEVLTAGAQASKANSAGKEAQPQQSDRAAGWSMGGPSRGWEPLDLSGGGDKLPPPGDYDGVIADLEVIDKSDVLWMIVSFKLVGLEASPAPEIVMIASRNDPVDEHRVAKGMRLLNRLAAATATPLEAIRDPYDLPGLFIGKLVNLTVAHKERDRILELVVRTIRPR